MHKISVYNLVIQVLQYNPNLSQDVEHTLLPKCEPRKQSRGFLTQII